jgi:type IX secretion system PorP/SprF family membrane protein
MKLFTSYSKHTSRAIALLWCALFSVLAQNALAQDARITEWTNATQLANPALTGEFQQNVKGTILHRKQWGKLGEGYSTNVMDAQYKMLSYYSDNYMGFGLVVLQDKAGLAQMRTFSIMGSAATHMVVNRKNLISAGAQLGYVQRSLDITGLKWDAQFNGISYDPSLDDKERLLTTKDGNLDIGAGINWKHKGNNKVALGYAILHTGQQITYLPRGNDRLGLRQTWHGSLWKRYEFFTVRYDAFVQRQSGAMEVVTGITFDSQVGLDSRYTTDKTSSSAKAGLFWRYKDAIHPFVGFEYKHFLAATLGWDIRIRKVQAATGFVGGPEISISYLGTFERRRMKVVK